MVTFFQLIKLLGLFLITQKKKRCWTEVLLVLELTETTDGRLDGGAVHGVERPGTSCVGDLARSVALPDADSLTLDGELSA